MSVLFEEQNDDVVTASSEAVVPKSAYQDMLVQHESIALKKLHEIVSLVGGTTKGEETHV